MNVITVVIIVAILILLQGIGLWLVMRRRENAAPKDDGQGLLLIQNQMEKLERALDARMHESSREIHETVRSQLGESSRLIKEITQEITSVKEIGRETGKFAEQLRTGGVSR